LYFLSTEDPDNDPITIININTSGTMGSVYDNGNGILTYTPKPNWFGDDTFQYTIEDSCGATSTATVTVEVESVGS
jgi:hypothetical protein